MYAFLTKNKLKKNQQNTFGLQNGLQQRHRADDGVEFSGVSTAGNVN